MIKETITYTDYNGVERTEDFYFDLNEAEITEMEMSTAGGLGEMIKNIVAAQDAPAIIKIFKDLIAKAYGKKSPDGKYFEKSEQISREFMQTKAYPKLFMKLATDSEAASKFINGIIPEKAV